METWQTILLAFGGNAALLAVLGVIGKSLLDKLILRDTKQFESELKAKSDAAIEHLKNELQFRTIEHQVRFSRLHEKRADVIANLYELLADALREAELFLSPTSAAKQPDENTQLFPAEEKLLQLYRYFDNHKIYLPSLLCDSLKQLIEEVKTHVTTYAVHLDPIDGSTGQENREARRTALKAIQGHVVAARISLENEFRSLLGAAR